MTDWSRVKSIFQELIELPQAERGDALGAQCGDDAEVRRAVEALLEAHDRAGSFMQKPPTPHVDAVSPDIGFQDAPQAETQIDGYRLLDVIGEGGYGTVYKAQQETPVRREVALKVIKAGMDTHEVIRRFESERQTLALMSHPNVAGVLDAGTTAQGRPYFVMEFVDGRMLTAYCDEKRLSINGRLNLLIQVCDAIQHAHQKGVIHRDIKPGNVMVVDDGTGSPRVKVIDFGIAKAIEGQAAERGPATMQGMLIGTPEYMSPEQADPGRVDIDTRTDIYSLGVLLYELITGTLPFSSNTLRSKGLAEIQRIVREETPPRPSRRLTEIRQTQAVERERQSGTEAHAQQRLNEIAQKRGMDARELRRRVSGELDWIVMKCLEKERGRRYESASDIAAEIRRFMRNEPVQAGPPGAGYRVAKFVRRHRSPVLAALVTVVALVAGFVLALVGLQRATAARRDADAQRDVARQKAEDAQSAARRAEAINAFLQDILASADPRVSAQKDLTVRAAVERALAQVDAGELKEEPLIEAAVRLTIARSLSGLADYDAAVVQSDRARAIYEKALGPKAAEVGRAWHQRGSAEKLAGQAAAAEGDLQRALAIFESQDEPDALAIAGCRNDLALTMVDQGRLDDAEPLLREVYAFAMGPQGTGTELQPEAVNNLGSLLMARGAFAEAERFFREAVAINEARHGGQHPNLATNLDNLAQSLQGQGKHDDALSVFSRALKMRRALFGNEHPDVATTLHNVAVLHYVRGELPPCEAALRESLDIFKSIYGLAHADTLTVNDSLVSVLGTARKLDEAETLLLAAYRAAEDAAEITVARKKALAARLAQLYNAKGDAAAGAQWQQVADRYITQPTSQPNSETTPE